MISRRQRIREKAGWYKNGEGRRKGKNKKKERKGRKRKQRRRRRERKKKTNNKNEKTKYNKVETYKKGKLSKRKMERHEYMNRCRDNETEKNEEMI